MANWHKTAIKLRQGGMGLSEIVGEIEKKFGTRYARGTVYSVLKKQGIATSPDGDTARAAHRITHENKALKQRAKAVQNQYESAIEALADTEAKLQLFTATSGKLSPPKVPSATKSRGDGSVILVATDWHSEQKVERAHVSGLNEFNLEVADRRIKQFCNKAITLTENARSLSKINTCTLAFLGDLITGTIHDELLESNFLSPPRAVMWVQDRAAMVIRHVLDHGDFDEIDVICTPGNHGRCHDSETELLTSGGWKRYTELSIGDVVATYNMETEAAEWQPLQDLYVDIYDGPMVSVKHESADWMVTPRHRMVLRDYHSDKASFVEMKDLSEKTIGCKFFPKFARGSSVDLPGVTDDELRLIGWVITDGSYKRNDRGVVSDVVIHQSKPKNLPTIRGLLKSLGCEFREGSRHRNAPVICGKQVKSTLPEKSFRISSRSTGRLLELLPNKKRLSNWMWNLSERQVCILLEAVKLGDGANGNGKHYEIHGKKDFLGQLQALLIVNGISSRVRKNCRGDAVLSVRSTRRGYINNWNKSVTTDSYKGAIWCGTVANGTLITRRNGIPLISGNTTQKIRVATRVDNSYEWIIYQSLAREFRGDKRVNFKIAEGYHVYHKIQGWNCRFHHGDAIKYGGGVGGITIPVNKAIASWNKSRVADYDFFGHWHQFIWHKRWVCCPCLIGYDDFSLWIKAEYEEPSQMFAVMDKDRGLVEVRPIFVDSPQQAIAA